MQRDNFLKGTVLLPLHAWSLSLPNRAFLWLQPRRTSLSKPPPRYSLVLQQHRVPGTESSTGLELTLRASVLPLGSIRRLGVKVWSATNNAPVNSKPSMDFGWDPTYIKGSQQWLMMGWKNSRNPLPSGTVDSLLAWCLADSCTGCLWERV